MIATVANVFFIEQVKLMKSWSGILLTVFLMLSVIAGSISPPSYAHSHANGLAPHDHNAPTGRAASSREHTHAHGHHHHHGHGHHHGGGPQNPESADASHDTDRHWHVSLFFFDFTLPGLPGSDGNNSQEGDDQPVVVSLVDLSRVTPGETVSDVPTGFQPAEFDTSQQLFRECLRPAGTCMAERLLLCDTARRERSGVLLT